ncbi:potassium-transporting ATPase subunit KdpC [Rhodoblastus acidophilus]|uniref:Potassium-transporting ATPase KdpC subunit n=1 Tax=Candidatus Rhodoblastus alkanivorans TaxID=2954117 RepID=A0ABS9Z7I3_9HYPH|nr:potassium-transporting ATPase subunit KdpC [Candidatus Rhodoblastus alkanivorans]MCI4678326.1 potassium-transporting ATPase subunit KdpC [Candidatus Rhodoblastus alkanivorans]MCI4683584.1 potassium-transporting ATPase subunit KdpC [Candidatus Rhodoblastus alkanivorans]MDI4640900.1 potassium-transporting ATPase subunit KdpC [Rhodoblastus acidophilus]
MLKHFRPALVLLVLFTVLTGLVYPFAITGVASIALPRQAGGSLIVKEGKVVGSSLIGQNFASARYFQPRPSATVAPDPRDPSKTVDAPYNAANSSGSNLGPTSKALIARVAAATEAKKAAGWTAPLPADALTTSASGLDPDISPQNALAQVAGVAKARGLDERRLRDLVAAQTEARWIGVIGEPRVNVLSLNLALDELK